MKTLRSVFVVTAALVVSTAAMATSTFELYRNDPSAGACSQVSSGNGSGMGNSYDCSAVVPGFGDELNLKAYSNSGSGSTFAAARLNDYDPSGFGVSTAGETTSSPQHSMDNNGNLELMLFQFDSSIALSSIKAGWFSGDSDVSVLAYTGVGNAVTDLTNATKGSLLSTGWSLVGNYLNIDTNTTDINAAAISSSYWIVAAYSDSFAGTSGYEGNDYIKLQKVSGNFTCVNSNDPSCSPPSTGVSEPASLALAGLALLGVVGSRRRKVSSAA